MCSANVVLSAELFKLWFMFSTISPVADKLTQLGIDDPYFFLPGMFTDFLKGNLTDVLQFDYPDLYHYVQPITGIKSLHEPQLLQSRVTDGWLVPRSCLCSHICLIQYISVFSGSAIHKY